MIFQEKRLSSPYGNNGSFLAKSMYMWMGIYMGIGLLISFVIPFLLSLLAIFMVIIGIDYVRARYIMKKMGVKGIKQIFSSFSGSPFGYQPLKYYCMSCGTEHRETSCPKCGSKMTRVG
jgi:hypothetical protein